MPSAEYQKTVPPKFIIIIHNYANVWTVMQPIKLTTQFSGSDVTGRHYWFFDSEGAFHYTGPTGPRPLGLTKGKWNASEPKVRPN